MRSLRPYVYWIAVGFLFIGAVLFWYDWYQPNPEGLVNAIPMGVPFVTAEKIMGRAPDKNFRIIGSHAPLGQFIAVWRYRDGELSVAVDSQGNVQSRSWHNTPPTESPSVIRRLQYWLGF
jgi:hypothetical protein